MVEPGCLNSLYSGWSFYTQVQSTKRTHYLGLTHFTDGLGKGGLDLKLQPLVKPPIAHSSSSQQNILTLPSVLWRFEQTRQNGEQRSETNRYSFSSPLIAAGNGPSSSSSCKIHIFLFLCY